MAYKLTDIVAELYADRVAAKALTALTGGTSGIEAVIITAGGSGYLSAPTVVFTPTSGGSGAAGTAILSGTAVVAVLMTAAGSGYITAPTVSFTPVSGGSGAAGTALLRANCLDAIPTAARSVGMSVFSPVSSNLYLHTLTAGTDAEASPLIVRPDDYAASTNEKVWKLLTLGVASLRCEDTNGIGYFGGKVGIGDASPSSAVMRLRLSAASTNTATSVVTAESFVSTWTPGGTVTAGVQVYGVLYSVSTAGSADMSATNVSNIGLKLPAFHGGTGTLSINRALELQAYKNTTGPITTNEVLSLFHGNLNATGTIGSSYGLRVLSPTATGTITTAQGIRVEAQASAGVTTPHSIYLVGTTDRMFVGGFVQHAATAAPGSPLEGDLWNDSTRKCLQGYLAGIKSSLTTCIFTQTATVTVSNTTSELTILGSGIGSLTLPANFFTVGKTIDCELHGHYSNAGTPTLRVRFYLGSTVIADTGVITTPSFTGDEHLRIRLIVTCRTTGASGSVSVSAECRSHSGASGGGSYFEMEMIPTEVTVDTTASQALNITAQWGTAASGNSIDSHVAFVKVLN